MREARAIVSSLAALGLPAATVTMAGKLHATNDLFQGMMPSVLADFSSRIRFTSPDADQTFEQALQKLKRKDTGRGGITFPVPASKTTSVPTVIHLVPLTGSSREIFSGAGGLLVAIPVAIAGVDPLILEGLFDLTVAESYVARGIAEGRSVEKIAALRNTSIETIRSQLKSVMQKTGTHRQHELAALLKTTSHFGDAIPQDG